MPITQTLTASRNASWAPTLIYPYLGAALPLTGATIDMQLRLYPGQPGAPGLALSPIGFVDALESGTGGADDEQRTLTLSPVASRAQLAALPQLGEVGDDSTFAFDIRITYADGQIDILSSGSFILSPGVTTT